MENPESSKPILVLCGTGKTGSRIVQRLQKRNIPVRVGSRSAQPAFDWQVQTTWEGALAGVSAVYISYYPDLAVPGAVEAIRLFAELALSKGVSRLVLLSGRGEEEAQLAEETIKNSGADWTILRASWFAQNFSESFLLDAVLSGTVALPVGEIGEPFIDAGDIADVAVAALTQEGHSGELYELTGPRLMTFRQAVAEVAQARGEPVDFVQITPDQYSDALKQAFIPMDVIGLVMYLFTTVLDGRNAHVSDGVERALGRPPRDFTAYAKDTAASAVWSTQK